jgi:hypothetical protein
MLPMLEPATFPNGTSPFPPRAALMPTASSGALAPKATTVSPMITGTMPRWVAMESRARDEQLCACHEEQEPHDKRDEGLDGPAEGWHALR